MRSGSHLNRSVGQEPQETGQDPAVRDQTSLCCYRARTGQPEPISVPGHPALARATSGCRAIALTTTENTREATAQPGWPAAHEPAPVARPKTSTLTRGRPRQRPPSGAFGDANVHQAAATTSTTSTMATGPAPDVGAVHRPRRRTPGPRRRKTSVRMIQPTDDGDAGTGQSLTGWAHGSLTDELPGRGRSHPRAEAAAEAGGRAARAPHRRGPRRRRRGVCCCRFYAPTTAAPACCSTSTVVASSTATSTPTTRTAPVAPSTGRAGPCSRSTTAALRRIPVPGRHRRRSRRWATGSRAGREAVSSTTSRTWSAVTPRRSHLALTVALPPPRRLRRAAAGLPVPRPLVRHVRPREIRDADFPVEALAWFWQMYLQREGDGDDVRADPLRATSYAGLPPALVQLAALDVLTSTREAAGRPDGRRRGAGGRGGLSGKSVTASGATTTTTSTTRRRPTPRRSLARLA